MNALFQINKLGHLLVQSDCVYLGVHLMTVLEVGFNQLEGKTRLVRKVAKVSFVGIYFRSISPNVPLIF